ncbi:MAG: 16S rRNA processing protein RimM [Tannerella sp.]|nr:16S rRNA processing protein RimM [Tannerella sp.]
MTKPHGIKGEISLLTDYDISGISGNPYIVCNMDGIWVPFFIRSYRQKSNTVTLVKLEDIDSEDDAKLLTGKAAYVPLKMLPPGDHTLINREYIAGYTVIENKSGEIGQVKEVDDSTLNILLKVDYKGNEILIPAALITAINQEHKTMEASLPEGFLEI